LQGLILSNALRAQKDAEYEGCTIALNNLRSEVIELRIEYLRKQLFEAKEKCAVAEAKREISDQRTKCLEKTLKNFVYPRKNVLRNLWIV
jgi:hypothetical protein